jgi:5-methylcytosine-specific restriction endonuclease McrA
MLEAACAVCGRIFSYRKGSRGTHEYCSNPCRWKGDGKKREGIKRLNWKLRKDGHPNWKGGISDRPHEVREAVIRAKAAVGKCLRCGSVEHLQGHHKVAYSEHPELGKVEENIEVLCSVCHAKEHPEFAGMIQIPRVRSGLVHTCALCGKSYYRPLHIVKTRFCSRSCSIAALRSGLMTPPQPLKGKTLVCKRCGKQYYRVPSDKPSRFCSRSCVIMAMKRKEFRLCPKSAGSVLP